MLQSRLFLESLLSVAKSGFSTAHQEICGLDGREGCANLISLLLELIQLPIRQDSIRPPLFLLPESMLIY